MIAPIIRRMPYLPMECDAWWKHAAIIVIPGDRREAMRFALEAFEARKVIWHLGAGDGCPGDAFHYDGTYRKLISQIAKASGGKTLGLRNGVKADYIVGPTMQDDIKDAKPIKNGVLLCYNPTPFSKDEIPKGNGFAMKPGDPGACILIRKAGWTILPRMNRSLFLRFLAGAKRVIGNSSLLTYEAPVFHADRAIEFIGDRNRGRGIVRWKGPCPSDAVVKLLVGKSGLGG